MQAFLHLLDRLERSPGPGQTRQCLVDYFSSVSHGEASWAVWFLAHPRLPRPVKPEELRRWAGTACDMPDWMVAHCASATNNLAEALALLHPSHGTSALPPLEDLAEQRWAPLTRLLPDEQRQLVERTWEELDAPARIRWNQLLTGGLGLRVPELFPALSHVTGVEPAILNDRLAREAAPGARLWARLTSSRLESQDRAVRPFPFRISEPCEDSGPCVILADNPTSWRIEPMWRGTRVQLLRRSGHAAIWSLDGMFLTTGLADVLATVRDLPEGTVLDGVLISPRASTTDGASASRTTTRHFVAFDVLESKHRDLRHLSLEGRRPELERLVTALRVHRQPTARPGLVQGDFFAAPIAPEPTPMPAPGILLSPSIIPSSWDELRRRHPRARGDGFAGWVLKRRDDPYIAEPTSAPSPWWRWDAPPLRSRVVLLAVQPAPTAAPARATWEGTFAARSESRWIPVARCPVMLAADEEMRLDDLLRTRGSARFGPVRSVAPTQVFELEFDDLLASSRRRAGFEMLRPRVVRWRPDLDVADADSLEALRKRVADECSDEPWATECMPG